MEELAGTASRRVCPIESCRGSRRTGPREFAHHVSVAYGSLCELETQVLIAEQLGYSDDVTTESLTTMILEVRRLIGGLLRSLRARTSAEALQ